MTINESPTMSHSLLDYLWVAYYSKDYYQFILWFMTAELMVWCWDVCVIISLHCTVICLLYNICVKCRKRSLHRRKRKQI